MESIQTEKGFTLISYLIGFTMFIFLLPLLVSAYDYLTPVKQEERFSIELFFSFLQDELIEAFDVQIGNEILTMQVLDHSGYVQTGTFEVSKTHNFVRKVNNGHEILARNIKKVRFKKVDRGVSVSIETIFDTKYERMIFYE